MAAPILKAGAQGAQTTGVESVTSDKDAKTITVEGLYSDLEALTDAQIYGSDSTPGIVPAGYTVVTRSLIPAGKGMGKLVLNCIGYYTDASEDNWSPVRTTFHIGMEAVEYDLIDHPALSNESVHDICAKWLASDEAVRFSGGNYSYTDENGNQHQIADETALKFCRAYQSGIKTFNRYYPVIEMRSIWKNPPGLTRNGRSFTGGTPAFSENMGAYNQPPITLKGYPEANWYKSHDEWTENENTTWTRLEQWTYTPEGRGGQHGWIYAAATGNTAGANNDGGGDAT